MRTNRYLVLPPELTDGQNEETIDVGDVDLRQRVNAWLEEASDGDEITFRCRKLSAESFAALPSLT